MTSSLAGRMMCSLFDIMRGYELLVECWTRVTCGDSISKRCCGFCLSFFLVLRKFHKEA